MGLAFKIQKISLGIRIRILKIRSVPIFKQIFLAQICWGFKVGTSSRYHLCQFLVKTDISAHFQLISFSTQLLPPPSSSFQPPPSSLEHPQQYLNQSIACNWAISPNLGRKIKSCPFWLKIGTHGISEVLIPNPEIPTAKSIFGQIWTQKFKVVRFV